MWGFCRLSWDENRSAGRVRTVSRDQAEFLGGDK